MPPCKNDAKRAYAGTEPSPKGLGWCAHAEAHGATRKGKDGRMWIVSVDRNGTKAWKPRRDPCKSDKAIAKKVRAARRAEKPFALRVPTGKADKALTFKNYKFSDGTSLSWAIGTQPELTNDKQLTRSHWGATISRGDIVLRLDRGSPLPAVDVTVPAPATVGKALQAMHKFYSTPLSENDYVLLETELGSWNPNHVGRNMASFKKQIRTYGHTKGDHVALGGLYGSWNPLSNVYEPSWSS